jgi:hypothetical protein
VSITTRPRSRASATASPSSRGAHARQHLDPLAGEHPRELALATRRADPRDADADEPHARVRAGQRRDAARHVRVRRADDGERAAVHRQRHRRGQRRRDAERQRTLELTVARRATGAQLRGRDQLLGPRGAHARPHQPLAQLDRRGWPGDGHRRDRGAGRLGHLQPARQRLAWRILRRGLEPVGGEGRVELVEGDEVRRGRARRVGDRRRPVVRVILRRGLQLRGERRLVEWRRGQRGQQIGRRGAVDADQLVEVVLHVLVLVIVIDVDPLGDGGLDLDAALREEPADAAHHPLPLAHDDRVGPELGTDLGHELLEPAPPVDAHPAGRWIEVLVGLGEAGGEGNLGSQELGHALITPIVSTLMPGAISL